MEIKEAKLRLNDHFIIHDDGRPTPYLDEAVILMNDCMKKQIPKKPEIEYARNAQNEKIIEFGICPECEEELDYIHVKETYCPRCGQRIDWTEDE